MSAKITSILATDDFIRETCLAFLFNALLFKSAYPYY